MVAPIPGRPSLNSVWKTRSGSSSRWWETSRRHVVAHSYGGVVALAARALGPRPPAFAHPDRAGRVPRSARVGDREAWSEVDGFGERYVARIAAGDTETALREFVDYLAGRRCLGRDGRAGRARRCGGRPASWCSTFARPSRIPAPTPGVDIRLPVRLLTGDKSPLLVRRIAAILAERLPSATLQVVAGADHFLPMTHHELLGALLLEKLSN